MKRSLGPTSTCRSTDTAGGIRLPRPTDIEIREPRGRSSIASHGKSQRLYCEDHTFPVTTTMMSIGTAATQMGSRMAFLDAERQAQNVPALASATDATLTKPVDGHR